MAAQQPRPGELISGINITPLVDVVLVLLIVLMVTASYTVSRTLPLDLPKASTGESKSTALAISVDAEGRLFLEGIPLPPEELAIRIRSAQSKSQVNALIAADGSAQHRHVVQVIDLIRREGVTKFAINVAPSELTPKLP